MKEGEYEINEKNEIIVNLVEKPKESDVGITAFIRNGEIIPGLIKHLVTDFQVREISLDGIVADIVDRENVRGLTNQQKQEIVNSIDHDDFRKRMYEIIGDESNEFCDKIFEGNEKRIEIQTALDREKRIMFHSMIKELPNYDSSCDNGKLVVKKGEKKTRGGRDKGAVLRCVMRKSNIDTSEAIGKISKALNLGKNAVCFAGMKDKRGVTCQFVTIPNVTAQNVEENMKKNVMNGITLSNFEKVDAMLKLGDLKGNEFRVVIREIQENEMIQNCEAVKTYGYINYFGLQRFGSLSGTTHLIGKEILRNQFKAACDLIMKEGNDNVNIAKGKQYYKEGEYRKAYEIIPFKSNIEKSLCGTIDKHIRNGTTVTDGMFKKVIDESIQHKTKSLYIHAYQSYIWNKVVSRRFETFGKKVLIGDLYMNNEGKVEVVNESNIESIELSQIVIPLVSREIQMPQNEMKTFIEEEIQKDGFTLEEFPKKIMNVVIYGDFRKIVIKPNQMEFEVIEHNDINEELVDERGYPKKDIMKGDRKAIWIKFQLESSAYATMLFRELLKMSTDLDNQKQLTREIMKKMEEE